METKHTKGEWQLKESTGVFKIIDPNGKKDSNGKRLNIANVFYEEAWRDGIVSNLGRLESEVRRTKEEAEANAKLIAASPDLLEALLIAHDIIALRQPERPELNIIKNAINKAIK
jgi:hypothetical protein